MKANKKLNMEKKEFDLKMRAQKLEESRFEQAKAEFSKVHELEREKLAFEELKFVEENKIKRSENFREWLKTVILYVLIPIGTLILACLSGADLLEILVNLF